MAEFYRPVWNPYEEATPVMACPECGQAIYDGEMIYYGHGTDHILGCEHCLDARCA